MTTALWQVYHNPVSSAASSIPDESALLCESCGYTLSGLPDSSACPECGMPIAESSPLLRYPSEWEQKPGIVSFVRTSWEVLFRPKRFFRSLATRGSLNLPRRFAWIHWAIAAGVFMACGVVHGFGTNVPWFLELLAHVPFAVVFLLMAVAIFIAIAVSTRLAVF